MRRYLIALSCLLMLVAANAPAASDYLLEIDGIPGESSDAVHPNTIEILSYSWGESLQAGVAAGPMRGGKVSFQDFHFVSQTSKASPLLFLQGATGKHIPKAVLYARKAGDGKPKDYLVIKLTDCVITSYQNAASGGSLPVDQVSLYYGKIEFEYREQKPDGSLDTPITTAFDVKNNKRL